MNPQVVFKQLLHDMKKSWQKSALLCVLLLIGCIFWVPPLAKSLMGSSSSRAHKRATAAKSAASLNATKNDPTAEAGKKTIKELHWQTADTLLEEDPLLQSAELASIQGNPFQIDADQFPPPVLFEPEPEKPKVDKKAKVLAAQVDALKGAVLRSTIVGTNRRAAFINSRLYQEGREVRINGQAFLLSAVFPKKVVLEQGNQKFELTLKQPEFSGTVSKTAESSNPAPQ